MQSISAILIKPFTKPFIKAGAKLICISLLLITQIAHADFRKALDAYQKRDGATMLKEVKDAVDKSNDDGLMLFLSVLERDTVFSQNWSFLFEADNGDKKVESRKFSSNTMGKYVEDYIPWLKILPQGNTQEFLALLQKASEQSSLESHFRLINLRSPYGLYDMFSYDEVTKLEVSKSIASNIYRKQLPALANDGYNEILYFLTQFTPQAEREARQQKLLAATYTRSLLLQAVSMLTRDINKRTEMQGLRLMKSALAKSDASYFYADIAAQMSTYYLKKEDKRSLKQAYLWALVELTMGEPYPNGNNNKPIKGLSEFKRVGAFKKIGLLELDAIWSKNSPTQNWDYRTLPNELKELKQIEWPELISRNQTINLKTQPILSFHHFNYDNQIVPLGISAKNYLIDIYADGRVNFAVGPRFDRTQNYETLLTLSPQSLKQLLTEFNALGFENVPLNTITKKSCGLGGCAEFYSNYNHIQGLSSNYYITKRDSTGQRTVIYYLLEGVEDLPDFPAKVFTMLENRLHTQQYRCGSVKERAYYKYCIDFDNKTLTPAN